MIMTFEELRATCKKEDDAAPAQPLICPLDDIDDFSVKASDMLCEWNLLWELIRGKHLRDLMSAALYTSACDLHKKTNALLRDWVKQEIADTDDLIREPISEEMRQVIEDIRVVKAEPAIGLVPLAEPWKDQFCADCWRPREKDADTCTCGCARFQTVKTSEGRMG